MKPETKISIFRLTALALFISLLCCFCIKQAYAGEKTTITSYDSEQVVIQQDVPVRGIGIQSIILMFILGGISIFLSFLMFRFLLLSKSDSLALKFGTPWFRKITLVFMIVFLTTVISLAWLALEYNRRTALSNIEQTLKTVLDTTTEGLNIWVVDQMNYLKRFGSYPELALAVEDLLKISPENKSLLSSLPLASIREFFKEELGGFGIEGFFIINRDYISIASMRDANIGSKNIIAKTRADLLKLAFMGETVFIPPLRSDVELEQSSDKKLTDLPATLFIATPVRSTNGEIIAVMTQRLNVEQNFSRIIRLGRIGKTGETYAFDQKGYLLSESRFTNQLRRTGLIKPNQKSVLNIKILDPGINLLEAPDSEVLQSKLILTRMAASAVLGEEGYDLNGYRGYRGVQVYGAWLWSDDLGIGVATEIEVKEAMEIYNTIRITTVGIIAVTIILSVGAILFTLIMGERANRVMRKTHTELKEHIDELNLAKNVIDNAVEGIVITDLNGTIQNVNNAFERMTGYSRNEAIGNKTNITKSDHHDTAFYEKMWNILIETGKWEGEIWDRRKDGEVFPKWISISTVRDSTGKATHYMAVFADISRRKAAEEKLEYLAYFDSLTGLANRALFQDRLLRDIASAKRHKKKIGILFIDLDRFKNINDSMGHLFGDELLKIVANRLKSQGRETDTVARLGGDEFTILLTGIDSTEYVSLVARQILDLLVAPISLKGKEIHVEASIGIAMFPDDGETFEALTKYADMAMYQAKEQGRNNFQFFSDELNRHILERIALEEKLLKAVEQKEFILYYQPKVNLETNEIDGMEALVRWQPPDGELILPDLFIPVAEKTGIINYLGEWILETACMQAVSWHRKGHFVNVAVNLSAHQFQQKNMVQIVKRIINKSGIAPELLELEITESMVMGNVEKAITTMHGLRELGVQLSIDDFGTGYSSLNYLKRFPVNTLKIDASFVRDLKVDSDDAAIVVAIISLAKSLDLKVVAEGVETEEQLDFIKSNGGHTAQGYFFSKPIPPDEFEQRWLKTKLL